MHLTEEEIFAKYMPMRQTTTNDLKTVLAQIGLKLPLHAITGSFFLTAWCHYHTVIIIPHTESNMHLSCKLLND